MRIPAAGACLLVLLTVGNGALAQPVPKADNTAQNYGALQKGAVTAEKQGNSQNEVTVLAAIRKSIMSEKGLSTDAQNIKIVYSKKGQVILRGPVDSATEKAKVGELAKGCPGVMSIKNELTVAAKPH